MKFSIRYADQIIGALIILALGILVFVIFMLGSSQRWFSRDYQYKTYFTSAAGLSPNMPVQYKGFTIGHVKSIRLSEDDRVEVVFTIFDTYNDRVVTGPLVELIISPIGALGGSQFMFYPGIGTELVAEGGVIPEVNSYEGRQLEAQRLTARPVTDDSIGRIITQVSTVLDSLNTVLTEAQDAFAGSTSSSLGRTMGGLETAVTTLPASIEKTLNDIMENLNPILANLNEVSASLSNSDGTVMSILDSQGPVYRDLTNSLHSVSGTLNNLEKISAFIPSQLPQLAGILSDLNSALKSAQDVLISLTNNPLLKGGIPEYKESKTGGIHSRDMEF
ncbi:MAG: MlaD family protein [Treponema sp.]|nr:MlaD family protein [Treponema sp.]